MQDTTNAQTTAQPRGLERPAEGRMVAGVASALAGRLDVPEWVVRVAFILTAFMGGLGIVLYLAGWVLIPAWGESRSPAERFFSNAGTTRSWLGIGLIALAIVFILDELSPFDDSVVWAVTLLVVGFLLYSGVIPTPSGGEDTDPSPTPGALSGTTGGAAMTASAPVAPAEPGHPAAVTTDQPRPRRRRERSHLGSLTIGVALLAMGVLAALDVAPGRIDPLPRHYLAVFTVIVGLGLLVGAWRGRARWLILVGFLLVPALVLSPVLEIGTGDRFTHSYRPASFAELNRVYTMGTGSMDLDLTELPWRGQTVFVEVEGETAAIRIRVPDDVAVRGVVRADFGWLTTPRRAVGGVAPVIMDLHEPAALPARGEIVIDARVEVGTIHIKTVETEDR